MVNLSFTHLIFICIVIIGALWLSYYNIEKLHKEYIKLDQIFRQQNVRLEHMESLCSSISTSLLERAQKEEAMEQEEEAERNRQEEEKVSQNIEQFMQANDNSDLLKSLVNMDPETLSIHSDNEDNINDKGVDEKFIENIIDKYETQNDNDMITKDDDVNDDEDMSLTSPKEKIIEIEKKKKDKSKKEKNKKKKLVEDKKIVHLDEESVDEEIYEDEVDEEVDLHYLTVSELREKLQAMGASTRGSKSDLIDRLTQIKNIKLR